VVEISTDIKIATSIEQGTVCLYVAGDHIEKKRFNVVVNRNPKSDNSILMVTITSQIEKAKNRIARFAWDPETLVEVGPSEYVLLSMDSIINCNNVVEIPKRSLIEKIDNGGEFTFEKLPQNVVSKIQSGILKSLVVSQDHKEMVI